MFSRQSRRAWFRRGVAALALLVAADAGLSLALRAGRVRAALTARLEAAFGRPVQVGRYGFSLLGGPSLEANSITVAEDPRFGREYFLRAERLSARVRWRSLLRGRFEFGKLSFARPSLNLVRAADGRWNLEDWLPAAPAGAVAAQGGGAARARRAAPQLYAIQVQDGRINFKRGVEKHPFALVGVDGRFDQERPGLWRISLDARPVRAEVVVQDAGALRVRGRVGGTSARLRPADLQLVWQDASLADALRLLRGYDYGVRGRVTLELAAHSEGEKWSFGATLRARNLHRWNLPLRSDDPALNLKFGADWWPEQARVEFADGLMEAPRSAARFSGFVRWAPPPGSPAAPAKNARLEVASSGIDAGDLLAWYRAFHADVAEDLGVEGTAGLELEASGWPPHIERAVVVTDGLRVGLGGVKTAVRVGRFTARLGKTGGELSPVAIAFARQGGNLRVTAKTAHHSDWRFEANLEGKVENAEDARVALRAFGWKAPAWSLEGPVGFALAWKGKPSPFEARLAGTVDLRGATLRLPFLNQAIRLGNASLELNPTDRRLLVGGAQAFGARWNGWLRGTNARPFWKFDLAADRLDVAELDRWLNPQQRPSLLERIFGVPQNSGAANVGPGNLQARGRLGVKELVLAPLTLRALRGECAVEGRNVALTGARAEFYGGAVQGSLRAKLAASPSYEARVKLQRVNLALLANAFPALRGRFAGTASGDASLTARGIGRESLRDSLEARGELEVRDAADRRLDWVEFLEAGSRRPGASAFRLASVRFHVEAGQIEFEPLLLRGAGAELEARGSVGFSRSLNLRVRRLIPAAGGNPASAPLSPGNSTFHLTGSLDAPQIVRAAPTAGFR